MVDVGVHADASHVCLYVSEQGKESSWAGANGRTFPMYRGEGRQSTLASRGCRFRMYIGRTAIVLCLFPYPRSKQLLDLRLGLT